MELDKEQFKEYFEFERPDNSLMSYFGVGIEYFIFPLVLIVALLGSIKLKDKKE